MIAQLNIPEVQAAAPVDPYGSPIPQKKRSFESIYAQEENIPSQNTGSNSGLLFFPPASEEAFAAPEPTSTHVATVE